MGRNTAQIGVVGVAMGVLFACGIGPAWAQPDSGRDSAHEGCPARENVPLQLRPLNCHLAGAIASGLERSATFRSLVEKVGALNGIVYIDAKAYVHPNTKRVLTGALSHAVTTAGSHRVLHLTVWVGYGDARIAVMAHELQHAIEVLGAPDVSTPEAVDALFERIGTHAYTGIVETQAALDVERAVRIELSRRK